MDIQYLLFLQNLRMATGGAFDEFFNGISKFAVDFLLMLPFIIFWCVNKKWGYRSLITLCIGDLVNNVIKLTVCAYRPWIRSNLIEPAGDSKVAATGYSFPSGHTMVAASTCGTVFAWQWNRKRWIAVLCAVLIALTGFSRNFLGVHTPQDVVVAFAEAVILIRIIGFCQKKIDGNEKILDILSVVGVIAVIISIIYVRMKPYPMDSVDGVLLVDPMKMMNDVFRSGGMLLGLIIGSYIERHFVRYEIPVGAKNLPILGFVGFMIVFSWQNYFGPATIIAAFGKSWGNLISAFILWFFGVAIWPIFIRKWAND